MGKILCKGEELIIESNDGLLALTNYRVIHDAKDTGTSRHVSIPLSFVSSCGVMNQSRPWLLATALILALIAVFAPEANGKIPAAVFAFAFATSYFITRAGVIKISSPGGEAITVKTAGMKHEESMRFIRAVISQKHK